MTDELKPTSSTSGSRLPAKVVILTGAAGNIGTYISRCLLREGARLVMTGRDGDKLNAFIDELAGEGFDRANMVPCTGRQRRCEDLSRDCGRGDRALRTH